MQVSEIMHRGVTTANINDTIQRVAELMKSEDIGALPIMDDEKTVGFVTDRDIVVSCIAEGFELSNPISEAMNENVICVRENDDVDEATRLMKENQISRILVVDENERPVGMVSLHDLTEGESEKENAKVLSKIKRQ